MTDEPTSTPNTLDRIHPQLRQFAVPIESLNEDPRNANQHNDRSLSGIAASFNQWGQRKNLVVRRDGMILEAGNGTKRALQESGWTHLAVVLCDDDEAAAMAYGLADNQTARLSEWDRGQLAENLNELISGGWDPSVLGWEDSNELAELLSGSTYPLDLGSGPQKSTDETTTTSTSSQAPAPASHESKPTVEIDVDGMTFEHTCPRCKFEFNNA